MTKFVLFVCLLCLLQLAHGDVEIKLGAADARESRKLFGGYRITPRFCKPARKTSSPKNTGPSICMFNHECSQRNGQVIGACMDGFLFGACCQLPAGASGELIESDLHPVTSLGDNNLATTPLSLDIMSNGVSQIAQTLLNPGILPTAQDNAVVQLSGDTMFTAATATPSGGVTKTKAPETVVVGNNQITPDDFRPIEDRKTTTTMKFEDATVPYNEKPMIHISISSTPSPNFHKPMFRPKPQSPLDGDKYVLVPTITHNVNSNIKNKTDNEVINIYQILNSTSTKKPPSTSYIFSTTLKPRRTTTPLVTKKKTKPTASLNKKPTPTRIRPSGFSTVANSPEAFITTKRPPSTSYVYSSTPTRRPAPSTINTHIAGPAFQVTSSPGQYSSTYPSPAPTLIVLSPVTEPPESVTKPTTYQQYPSRKPVNSVTINNHVTQNIYSTSERPQPTVLITPKPSIASSIMPVDYYSSSTSNSPTVEVETSADELINFPPVRNPNLNMSNPVLSEDDITTPTFVEDEALNQKVESFVNQIIIGLQEPFQGLKDVVYNKNQTTTTTTKKPVRKTGSTTKKPTTTRRPTTLSTRRPQSTTKRTKATTKKPVTTTQSFIEEDTGDEDLYRNQCGVRPLLKSGRIVGGTGATFGEFPWQVLVRESTWLGLFTKNKCGGVLISNKYVMTAAHCQPGFLASLVAVFGEFDISGDLESRRPVSRNVKRVIVHRKYNPETFENDLALLELDSPVKFDKHIIPICLPRDGEDFTGRMATVTGWGRLKYGGGVPSVLQEVQVPIMENNICQEMFRTAGHMKIIRESFLCAGYAHGQKDSCEGDSGGPLVLQRPDGRYQLVGTVSHGIKCAAPYLPGVYMRTTYFKPWIVAITGIDSS